MKLELLAKGAAPGSVPIATIETVGPHGSQGVYCDGPAFTEAANLVDACRPDLTEKLGREPNGDELLASLTAGTDAGRFRKV